MATDLVIHPKDNFFTTAAIFAAVASCLVIPFASSLLSLFSILTFVFWLFSGKIKLLPTTIKENPVAASTMLLFGLFVIGILYSSADLADSLEGLKKYREIIFVPVLITLLKNNKTAQRNCEYSFITGCIVLMLISYSMYFSIIPSDRYGNSIVYHITHSYFMAILAFWSLHKCLDSTQYRYFWAAVFLLAVVNLFYIAPGRTGMLVFLCLMLLFLMQRLTLLQQMIGLFTLVLLVSAVFITSDNFSTRTTAALKEIQNYEHGSSRTSLGMRFDWWYNSIILIREKPFLGHGTGAFKTAHDRIIDNTEMETTDNPHNEYLFIGVQLGLVGLAVFLIIFALQLRYSFKLPRNDRLFVQGVVVAMAVGCLMNSFLFDSHQGHFWAYLSGIYFASYPDSHISL